MYINKNTHEILFDVIPKGIDWVKVPDDAMMITKDNGGCVTVWNLKLHSVNLDDVFYPKYYNPENEECIMTFSEYVENGYELLWSKATKWNKTENKTPMRLVLDVNGEYKARSNTGESGDTFIMDLLDGVEVLTKHEDDNFWNQWKPSQSMTDDEGKWVECGIYFINRNFMTYDNYLNRNKEDLIVIDLRVETQHGVEIFDHKVNTDSGYTRDAVHDFIHDNVHDVVHHPKHYTEDPSGVECIQLTSLLPCCLSNSLKYLWRCGKKDEDLQELKKALFYINYSIENNLPSFIQGVSDTLEFEKLIKQVKEYWNGDKYMFIDALYWGDQPTMKRAIENMISNITSNIEK